MKAKKTTDKKQNKTIRINDITESDIYTESMIDSVAIKYGYSDSDYVYRIRQGRIRGKKIA